MRNLFPSSWIEQANVFKHRHAAAAEALERSWPEWLRIALTRVSAPVLAAHGSDAVKTLRAVSGRALLSIDEALRTAPFRYRSLPDPQLSSATASSDDESLTDAYLFVASCNPNGFIREQALIAFARYPCPLAFAAGLIRSTDWVQQVRDAGISLVKEALSRLPPSDVVRYLEIAIRLNERARVSHDLWRTVRRSMLKSAEGHDALWAASRDPNSSSVLRRAAFELLLVSKSAETADVVKGALADFDPCIGLWALSQIDTLAQPQPDQSLFLLKLALRAKHSAVRRTALRLYRARRPDDLAETLRAALFDASRGVRTAAAFELEKSFGESPLPIWRAAVNDPERRRADAALLALCEFGERQDVENVSINFAGRNVGIRAGILRGLLRVQSAKLESTLATAIFDRSKVVIRQLGQIYRHAAAPLNVQVLDEVLAQAGSRVVPNLVALSSVLGKWEELEFLLRHAVSHDKCLSECAADFIDRWSRNENRRFTAPSSAQVQRLATLLRAAQGRHPTRGWGVVDRALATFS